MTKRNQFVTFLSSTLHGPIEPTFTLASPPAGRTFRRRRLGLLTGILVATLAVGGLVADSSQGASVVAAGADTAQEQRGAVTDDADGGVVVAQSSDPATLAEIFATTTSSLLAVTTTTVAEASTTTVPTTAPASTSPPPASTEPEQTSTASTSSPADTSTTAAPTTAAPTTTAAPRPSPSTTAAPASSEESDYSDPNTLQVWLDLAECEAGGNWSINTGNGYYGGLQFSHSAWESVGGSGYPHEHPRDTQIDMGRRLQERQGWGAWPHCSEKLGLR